MIIGIVGAGGCAREIMPLARHTAQKIEKELAAHSVKECVYVDLEAGPSVNGVRVISESAFLTHAGSRAFNIALGNGKARRAISERYLASGAKAIDLIASTSVIHDDNEIGEGAVICDNCIVTCNVKIGRFFQMNYHSYVAHDCVIGDFVTFAPRASCNGNIVIEDGAYIGAGAVLRQGRPGKPLRIGAEAVVGMGAVVLQDVAPGETVVGNPARPLVRKQTS